MPSSQLLAALARSFSDQGTRSEHGQAMGTPWLCGFGFRVLSVPFAKDPVVLPELRIDFPHSSPLSAAFTAPIGASEPMQVVGSAHWEAGYSADEDTSGRNRTFPLLGPLEAFCGLSLCARVIAIDQSVTSMVVGFDDLEIGFHPSLDALILHVLGHYRGVVVGRTVSSSAGVSGSGPELLVPYEDDPIPWLKETGTYSAELARLATT